MNHRFRGWLIIASLFVVPTLTVHDARAAEMTLALANSTCNAMKQAGDLYRAGKSLHINYSCKSSGLLAKGMNGGAISADIFVSADREWMDYAVDNGLVSRDKVASPWGNSLVVGVPKNSPLQLKEWRELASDSVTTILIGDPGTAPFGRYAKDALKASGLWERVKGKIQTRKNIELLADALAQADATTVGILFRTNMDDQLRQVIAVDAKLHKPIRYYVAPLKAAAGNEEVTGFLKFLRSRVAQEVFRAERFDVNVH